MKAEWHSSPYEPPCQSSVRSTLAETLADVARAQPAEIAVITDSEATSFSALALRVGGLARQLSATGATPGPVALLLSAGVDSVAAWFACAIAGRPFILLDEGNPPERNRTLLLRSRAAILLHDQAIPPGIHAGLPHLVCIQPGGGIFDMHTHAGLSSSEPAMIFPTSGSTGEPKLVVYSASTLQAKVQASIQLMGPLHGNRVVIAGTHANYGFIHHALVFLFSGRGIRMVEVRQRGLDGIVAAIDDDSVTNARFTPSLFRVAAGLSTARPALEKLRAVRFSGEPLLPADLELARAILHPACRIQNVYGSTESSLFIWTDDRTSPVSTHAVPIGHIYPSSQIRIVDENNLLVSDDEAGELIISSAHHALGDWEDGALDLQRFPADPRGGELRCYATGDIVRSLPGGALALIGRKDRLIKINGQRFSLNELESHLLAMPGCAQATVLERPTPRGNPLVAFLTPTGAASAENPDPRAWLTSRIPACAIPATFQWIDRMPLLPGGKVDHRTLLAGLDTSTSTAGSHPVATLTGNFPDLAEIWTTTLGIQDPALDLDFPSLGGDSLQFIELRHRVNQRFGKSIPLDSFQSRPTLRGLADILGIPLPADSAVIQAHLPLQVHFRLVHRADHPRRGIALGMPGMNGTTFTSRFIDAGMFQAFDVWECTIAPLHGDLLDGQRWTDAAHRIAEMLRDGTGPPADVFFGYSLAGYIAWLVDRALDGTPARPSRIICLDALAMHHTPRHRSGKHQPFLSPHIPPAAAFLRIHRKQPGPFRHGYSTRQDPTWHPSDGPAAHVDVATYDHDDLIQPPFLLRIASLVNRFAENGSAPTAPETEIQRIDTPAGNIFDMLCGHRQPTAAELSAFTRQLHGRNSTHAFVILQYLTLAHGHWEDATALLEHFTALHPQKHAPRYALLRMRRMKPSPPLDGAPLPPLPRRALSLQSFAAVDRALAIRQSSPSPILLASITHLPDRLGALALTLPEMTRQKIKPILSRLTRALHRT